MLEFVLGLAPWNTATGRGMVNCNYRRIDEDIFGKSYETFLAVDRKNAGILPYPGQDQHGDTEVHSMLGNLLAGLTAPNLPEAGDGTGIKVRQSEGQLRRNSLIEQQLHAAARIRLWRSRSAAWAKHAWIASWESCGTSAPIASADMPEDKNPKTSATMMWVPRIHGRPLRLPGSRTMKTRLFTYWQY